jgi:hypothetical protein
MKEHCRKQDQRTITSGSSSAIGEHCLVAHGTQPERENWDVQILAKHKRTQDRKEMEAKEINNLKPNLNRDCGVHIIRKDFKF